MQIDHEEENDIILCPTCQQPAMSFLMTVEPFRLECVPCGHDFPIPADFTAFLEAGRSQPDIFDLGKGHAV